MFAAIQDSVITPDELRQIVELCNSSNLTADEIYSLRVETFHAAIDMAIEDKRVTEEEETALYHIHSALQLPEDVFDEAEVRMTIYRNIYELERGNLIYFSVDNYQLDEGEHCHWIADVVLMKEKSKNQSNANDGGTKIKKGLTYRVGTSQGFLIAETDLAPIEKGALNVTNKRMIFTGESKTFDIPYDKLVDIGLYTDGMRFLVSDNKAPYLFKTLADEDIEAVGLLLSNAANGLL